MKATRPKSFKPRCSFYFGKNFFFESRRNSLFFIAPITCHHSKLIMSWKLSQRKTAELGFYSVPLPPFLHSSLSLALLSPTTTTSFCLFISVRSVIPPSATHISPLFYYFASLSLLFIPPSSLLFSPSFQPFSSSRLPPPPPLLSLYSSTLHSRAGE